MYHQQNFCSTKIFTPSQGSVNERIIESYCIGLSLTIKAQNFTMAATKLELNFSVLISNKSHTASGKSERVETSGICLRGATMIDSQLITEQALVDDA